MTGYDLRAWREQLGLTQDQMAARLEISRRKYQYAEQKLGADIGRIMHIWIDAYRYRTERAA